MSSKLTAYIDVSFTIEEDVSRFTEMERETYLKNKENIVELYKNDLLRRLDYYAHDIKDMTVILNFEEVLDARE